MQDWERRQALGLPPRARKNGTFNMTYVKEHGRLARARFSGTDFNVLHFLLEIVDHDGFAVATVGQIATAVDRSVSGVTVALRRLQDAGRIERVGRSGFKISREGLRPQNAEMWDT